LIDLLTIVPLQIQLLLRLPLLSQERVKLRTSNLAGVFTGYIRAKAP